MDLLDFSSDFLFPSNNGDELVIHQPVALTTSTEQSQEIEYQQVASSRTREPTGLSTGTNQMIPHQLATPNSYPWNSNWITNTTSESNLQEEPQTDLLSSTSNNNMFQQLQQQQFQELSRTIEEVLPLDLSEINVSDISIESTVPPSQPSSFSISHELNMAFEQTPSSTTSYTTTPAYFTAFVNPGVISNNSEQSSSQNQLFTQSYSGFVPSNLQNSTPQQSSFAPIINYNEQQTVNNFVLTPSTSGYTPSSNTQQTLSNRSNLYSRGTRTQHTLGRANVIPGSDIHSSRLAGSHDGPSQSIFHPYNTTGQQQPNSPHSLSRNRRLKHFQNSVAMNSRGSTNQGFLNTHSSSSDSANYYQRNVNPQTINPPSLAAAMDFRQQLEQNRLVFNRPVNSSETVTVSVNSGFESTSAAGYTAIRREAPSSVNNSSEDTSVFLPFSQAGQNPGCNIRRQNVKSNDSADRGPAFSAALQVTAARQLLVQAAASAAAAGATAFSQSLTEKTQNLERLIHSFCPAFLIGGRSQMKAFLSLTSSASTQSSPPRIPRCSVCLDKLISTILFPCRHFICETCAPKIDKCGLCRKIIEDRQRVFF